MSPTCETCGGACAWETQPDEYECPWCEYVTDSERDLVRHLAMAPASHAVLAQEENSR